MSKRGFKTTKPAAETDARPKPAKAATFKYTPVWRLLKPNLQLVRQHFVLTAAIFIVPSLLLILGTSLGGGAVVTGKMLVGLFITFIAFVWLLLNAATIYYFQLRVIGKSKPGIIESYRNALRYLPRMLGLLSLTGLLVTAGLLLFIVPGLIVFRRYFLAPYYLVDEDLGIREAMDRSAAATKPAGRYVWDVVAVMFVVSIITAGLGQLLPSPYGELAGIITTLAYVFIPALRYREIALQKSALTVAD